MLRLDTLGLGIPGSTGTRIDTNKGHVDTTTTHGQKDN